MTSTPGVVMKAQKFGCKVATLKNVCLHVFTKTLQVCLLEETTTVFSSLR